MKKIFFLFIGLALLTDTLVRAQKTNSFTDARDGRTYKTVTIGKQTWMAENLNYTAVNSWNYGADSSKCAVYGRLYSWEAAKTACPAGWHLPTNEEWFTLINYLGGISVAGEKMKAQKKWENLNVGATNSSIFTALPGGYRSSFGLVYDVGKSCYWWSATPSVNNVYHAGYFVLYQNFSGAFQNTYNKEAGFSVRCLKDAE